MSDSKREGGGPGFHVLFSVNNAEAFKCTKHRNREEDTLGKSSAE